MRLVFELVSFLWLPLQVSLLLAFASHHLIFARHSLTTKQGLTPFHMMEVNTDTTFPPVTVEMLTEYQNRAKGGTLRIIK